MEGIKVKVSKDVLEAIPQAVTFLSALPAEKTTTDVQARVSLLTVALDGEGVTKSELWEAVRHFAKTATFYPVPSEILERIKSRRRDYRKRGVVLADGRIAILSAPTDEEVDRLALERYRREHGRDPDGDRFDVEPRRALKAGATPALEDLNAKIESRKSSSDDESEAEHQERILSQIERFKETGSITDER